MATPPAPGPFAPLVPATSDEAGDGKAAPGPLKWLVGGAALALVAAGVILFLMRAPHLPSDAADGSYRHDCCGTIVLRDGEMSANGRPWGAYVVGEDEIGPYILPDRFVGTLDRGIELDGARPPVKLRLDTLPHPNRIVIPHMSRLVTFTRRAEFRYQPPRR